MRKVIFIILFLGIFSLAFGARNISLTTSSVDYISVSGDEIIVHALIYDSEGNVIQNINKEYTYDSLTPQVRSNVNNVMRLLSLEINKEYANNNSATWVDK